MSDIPSDLRYTEEHEYVKTGDEAGTVIVGITDYAQGELGDIVYVDLPDVGTSLSRMDVFGTIEAVKAVSELFSPLAGEVIEINGALENDPGLVNKDPYGDGWMIKMQLRSAGELNELLASTDYAQHVGE